MTAVQDVGTCPDCRCVRRKWKSSEDPGTSSGYSTVRRPRRRCRCAPKLWPEAFRRPARTFRQSVWLPAIKAAGVPERTFHDLRASNISWMLHGNVDLPRVMERVGHTQFQTTKRYTTVMEEMDDSAVDALDAVRAKYRKSS